MAAASEVVMFGFSIPSFVAGGILGLASLFTLALAYLTWRFLGLLRQSSLLKRQLAEVMFQETVSQETIEVLDAAFANARGYEERWRLLRRSLAVAQPETGGTLLVSSTPVRQIFNPQEILSGWFNMRLIETVPTLISSLGLLLTFLAILFGLDGAIVPSNSSSTTESLIEFERMRLGIVHLVSNLSGKFLASVCALGASFVFVFYERIVVVWSLSAISYIPRALDQIIQYQSADRVLREIQQAVAESVNRSRIVSAHIPQYIRQEVHNAAGATLERMEGALQQLCSIATTVKKRDANALPAGLADMSVGMLGEFQGISAHLKTMGSALEDTTRSFQQVSAALGESTGQMMSASKMLEGSLHQHAAQSKEQLEVLLNALELVGGRMQDAVTGTARTVTTGLEEAATKIKTSVDEAAASFAAQAQKDGGSTSAVAQVREVLEPLVSRAASMVGELNKSAIGVGKASAAMQATAAAVERGTAKLGEVAQSAEKLISQRDDGIQQLRELFERNGKALDGLSALAPAIKQTVAAAVAKTIESGEQRQAAALAALQRQIGEVDSAHQTLLRESSDRNAQLLQELRITLIETMPSHDDEAPRREEELLRYFAAADTTRMQVLDQVERFGGRLEELLGSAVHTIAQTVEQSSVQMQEAVSRMARVEPADHSSRDVSGVEVVPGVPAGIAGIDRLSEVLESSAVVMERSSLALEKVVQVAGEVSARGGAITEQSRALFEQHGRLLEQHRLVFQSFDRAIADTLGKLDSQLIKYNAEALEELRRQYVTGSSEHLAVVNRAVEETTASLARIPALLVESSDHILSASKGYEQTLQERAAQAGSDLTRAVSALESASGRLGGVVESVSERLSSSVEESTGRFEAVVTHAAATFSEISKRERQGTDALLQAKSALEKTVGQVVTSLSGLGDTLQAFEGLKQAIVDSAEAVGDGTAALSDVVAATQDLQAREEGWSAQTRALFEQNAESLKSYHEVFQTLDQSIAKIMAQLEEQIWRFQSRVQEQLQWSLQHYDELSARGLVAFESAITNLSDVLTDHRTSTNGSHGDSR